MARRGRWRIPPQCTTSREDNQIVRMAVTDRSVTPRTAQNPGYLRLQWSDEEGCERQNGMKVIFTDESRVCLQHPNGGIQSGTLERIAQHLRYAPHTGPAPGIMVWGGIGYRSRAPLLRIAIAGTLNSQRYISRLNCSPGHSSLYGSFADRNHVVHGCSWSWVTQITPQLPHQINFGNVWNLLGLLYSDHVSLFESMPRRVAAVISNNGVALATDSGEGTTLHRSL
ncbi:transposable element Tc1 transposase [Trichonephila clavipes]|nr:transposable element Tc1 transposase [Trichonephila clavipes]